MFSVKAKHERVLHQYGDRELWHADADDGSWQLPLFVEWRHDKAADLHFAHVTQGACFYPSQLLALAAILQVHDILGRKDQWLIPRRICEAILRKAPGITPQYYYRWPSDDSPPIKIKPSMRTRIGGNGGQPKRGDEPSRRSFVQWLSKERNISSSIINAVLDAMSWDAPVWLVQHRKALDLGFCRLVAVPFRANWKEIVSFKAKAHGIKLRKIFALPKEQVDEELERSGLPAMLTSPHNVGLRRGYKHEADVARIDYTIEAIASDQFESIVNRIEGERMARGPAAYVAEFEDAVEAVYKSAVQTLRAYLRKVAMPLAEVLSRRNTGFAGFVPVLSRKTSVRGTALGNLPVHVVDSGTRFSVYGRHSDQFLIPPAPAEVPAVSNILPPITDVRERTVDGNLQLLDGEGPDRLSLLPAPEGRAEGGSVLDEQTPAGAGLDQQGD